MHLQWLRSIVVLLSRLLLLQDQQVSLLLGFHRGEGYNEDFTEHSIVQPPAISSRPMDATSSLEQRVAKVLKEELREDENTREQSLEQFRDWILKNPDIQDCPTDDRFLLPFLRVRKHSVPLAEETLIKQLKFQLNFPSLHSNLDIEDPDINDVISSGMLLLSPIRESNGQAVSLFIPRNLDLKKHGYQSTLRSFLLHRRGMEQNELNQILGFISIVDCGQVSPAFFTMFPITMLKAVMESLEKSFLLRTKKFHLINLPPAANWILKLAMSVYSEKMKNRILLHSSLEELHQHVNPSALPKELGGTMPMDEMIGLWKKELAVHRETILSLNNIKLVGDSFKNGLGSNDTVAPDIQGSFRTLAVD